MKMFQCHSLSPHLLVVSLPSSLPTSSGLPTHRFHIRAGGLRAQLFSDSFPTAVESVSSIWLGPVCRDLESKQSLKSYDSRNHGWQRFLLLTIPAFPSGCLQKESGRLLSALITIRCTFFLFHFAPTVSHTARNP